MQGFKRSVRNEQAIPEQWKWAWERDDWPRNPQMQFDLVYTIEVPCHIQTYGNWLVWLRLARDNHMRRTEDIRLKSSMITESDDCPAWERAERAKHTLLCDLTPRVSVFLQDKELIVQEQFELEMRERRYEDAKCLDETILSQQSDLKQQLVLAIIEKRWLDTAHFRDSISRSGEE